MNAVTKMLGMGMSADDTPLDGRLGPHRRFEWVSCLLDDLKAMRKGLGCSINDVVLTIVTGAVREHLLDKGISVKDVEFKFPTPVSVRKKKREESSETRAPLGFSHFPLRNLTPAASLRSFTKSRKS